MKLIRNAIFALLLCLLCLLFLRSAQPLRDPGRVWVGGRELTGGGSAEAGGGSAVYDAATGTLTLSDAVITGEFRGAAIYAEGNLTILLAGDSRVEGTKSGCTVLGDLTVSGQGTLTLSGAKSGAAVHGCITAFDSAQLDLRGRKPLRWGKLHISPLDTVLYNEERMRVCAPNTVYLTDGSLDAAGNPLVGEPLFESFALKLEEPVPEPPQPQRAGYWFGGWYADPELTVPFDFDLPRSSPVTLYARWIRIVTLTYDCWGGEELPDDLYAWGDVPDRQPEPSREGYRFLAWYADDRLREAYDWSQPPEGDRTIYAKWEKNADITLYGIDAARYQGEVDWEAVKAGGVSFVFLRLGYRGYTSGGLNKDDNFEVNYEGAVAAGLDVGVYIFSQAVSEAEAIEEARYVLTELHGRNLDLPVVLDYELATDSSGYLGDSTKPASAGSSMPPSAWPSAGRWKRRATPPPSMPARACFGTAWATPSPRRAIPCGWLTGRCRPVSTALMSIGSIPAPAACPASTRRWTWICGMSPRRPRWTASPSAGRMGAMSSAGTASPACRAMWSSAARRTAVLRRSPVSAAPAA